VLQVAPRAEASQSLHAFVDSLLVHQAEDLRVHTLQSLEDVIDNGIRGILTEALGESEGCPACDGLCVG